MPGGPSHRFELRSIIGYGKRCATSTAQDIGIASRVRAARERLGWDRETLAFHSGISWSAIAQVEGSRRRNLRLTTLSALAAALGVTIDYLVRGAAAGGPMLEHRALFYTGSDEFINAATPFLAGALDRSEAAIVVTSEPKIQALRDQLGPDASQLELVERSDWLRTPSDALDALREYIGGKLNAGAPWIRILVEPLWEIGPESDVRLWAQFDCLLNLILSATPTSLLCGFDTAITNEEVVSQARVTHPDWRVHPRRDGHVRGGKPRLA